MEKRKIVKSGNSSFTTTLPIEWIKENNLKKGDEILIRKNEEGNLIFSTKKDKTIKKEYKTIKIKKDSEDIFFDLLDSYTKEYTDIIIEGEKINSSRNLIKEEITNFIGLDIIEQNPNSIVLKNFSSLDLETTPATLIKKLDMGLNEMFQILLKFFKNGLSKQSFFEFKKIGEQNQKLYYFARKIILKLIENPYLISEHKLTYHRLIKEKIIILSLMQISNLLTRVGNSFFYLDHTKKEILLLKELLKKINQKYKFTLDTMKHKKYLELKNNLKSKKNDLSKEKLNLYNSKNPLIIESINQIILIDQILIQMDYEIID